jgi:dCTP deaminase
MILKSDRVLERLNISSESSLVIEPLDKEQLKKSSSSAVDLRLGTRFLSTKHGRSTILDIEGTNKDINKQQRLMDSHYIPFGNKFILHPRDFVLGVTLEWIKLPFDLSGYVQGRSSWGRRGLVIATAVGVHSGFSGCLTLELTNLGEVPIAIYPGMTICQLFLHQVDTSNKESDSTVFFGKSKPVLGRISLDEIAKKLAGSKDS